MFKVLYVYFLKSEQNFVAKNDIDYFLVLNTDTMSWEKGKFIGKPPLNRYGHSATSIGPHVLIFGYHYLFIKFIKYVKKGGWEYSRATNEVIVLRDLSVGGNQKK